MYFGQFDNVSYDPAIVLGLVPVEALQVAAAPCVLAAPMCNYYTYNYLIATKKKANELCLLNKTFGFPIKYLHLECVNHLKHPVHLCHLMISYLIFPSLTWKHPNATNHRKILHDKLDLSSHFTK